MPAPPSAAAAAPAAGAYDFFAGTPAPAAPVTEVAASSVAADSRFAAVVPDQRFGAAAPLPVHPIPVPAQPVGRPESESGLAPKVGLVVTAIALLLSVVFQVSGHTFINTGDVVDVSLRRAVVLGVAFYVLVGAGLLAFVLYARVNLVWHRHGVGHALALGLPMGLAGGLVAVAVNSASVGHLASDPNVTAQVGGGGAARLFLTFVTVSALAPLVEETIFRGICAGSLLARNTRQAVWISAIAFAIWHLNPAALRYYALMGLVFAGIWLKRGLLASMSAHAAFNGVLTVAAVMATSGAAATTTFNAITVTTPGGWHIDHNVADTAPDRLLMVGPAGSALVFLMRAESDPQDALTAIEARLSTVPVQAGISVDPASITEVTTSLGPAVTGDFSIDNQPGHVIEVPYQGSIYELMVVTAGNPAAEHEWPGIINSLRAS